MDDFKHLLRTINTVKKHAKEQLPYIKLKEADMPVELGKLFTKGPSTKTDTDTGEDNDDHDHNYTQATESIIFFDPIDLFKTVLLLELFRSKIHISIIYWVNTPSELYYSLV